jgi:tryptophanyl-tRNA synthetase
VTLTLGDIDPGSVIAPVVGQVVYVSMMMCVLHYSCCVPRHEDSKPHFSLCRDFIHFIAEGQETLLAGYRYQCEG